MRGAPITRPISGQSIMSAVSSTLWVTSWPQYTLEATGGAVTLHVKLAGVGSGLPVGSMARTWNVWSATSRASTVRGLVQPSHAEPSIRHSNVEPVSLAEKTNVPLVSTVTLSGLASMVVSGAVVSGSATL